MAECCPGHGGGVAWFHEPGAGDHDGALAVVEGGFDEFDCASRADHSDVEVVWANGHDAQDVELEAADHQVVIAPGVAVGFDDVGGQTQGGGDVLFFDIPRARCELGGRVLVRAGAHEV